MGGRWKGRFMCRRGHLSRSQDAATNCAHCKKADRRAQQALNTLRFGNNYGVKGLKTV